MWRPLHSSEMVVEGENNKSIPTHSLQCDVNGQQISRSMMVIVCCSWGSWLLIFTTHTFWSAIYIVMIWSEKYSKAVGDEEGKEIATGGEFGPTQQQTLAPNERWYVLTGEYCVSDKKR